MTIKELEEFIMEQQAAESLRAEPDDWDRGFDSALQYILDVIKSYK